MSTALLKFCPKCESLYDYDEEDSKLILICKTCNNTEQSTTDKPIRTKYVHKTVNNIKTYALPTTCTAYEKAMYSTSKIACPNTECTTLVPKVLMFNRPTEDRVMYFYCTCCKHTWNY